MRRLILIASLGLVGCFVPSEEEIKARFAEYVAGANKCTVASECVLANTECPLGCYVAVRRDRKEDVEKKGRELVDDYERGGRSCIYGCVPPGPISCTAGRCAVEPDFGSHDAGAPDTRPDAGVDAPGGVDAGGDSAVD